MRRLFFLTAFALGTCLLGTDESLAQQDEPERAAPTQRRQHRLRVAQNPQMGFTNGEVDTILRTMTRMIGVSDFSWDIACNIEFVRNGNVISNANLPFQTTHAQAESALKTHEPTANVLIVSTISDCGGWQAAGCAPVGAEPMTVISDTSRRQIVVWLHERGHVVGRDHIAQNADAGSVPENQSKAVMFWNPSSQSTGVDNEVCNTYRNKNLPSIVSVAAAPIEPESGPVAMAAPQTYGLTDKAFQVLDSTWAEGMPVDQVNTLQEDDLSSIRFMLRQSVNDLWPHAIAVLAWRGNEADLALITRVLEFPASAPAGPITDEDKVRSRNVTRLVLLVPEAVGVLAARTKSTEAGSILRTLSHTTLATGVSGPAIATEISKQALRGLAISGLDLGLSTLNAATAQLPTGFDGSSNTATETARAATDRQVLAAPLASDVPQLSESEAARLKAIWAQSRQGQIEAFVRAGPKP